MADKYEIKQIENSDSVIVMIPSGPAKGEYEINYPTIQDGLIFVAVIQMGSKSVSLKLKAEEMPGLVAIIEARQARNAARVVDNRQNEIDQAMIAAGFEVGDGYAGSRAFNRAHKFNGEAH